MSEQVMKLKVKLNIDEEELTKKVIELIKNIEVKPEIDIQEKTKMSEKAKITVYIRNNIKFCEKLECEKININASNVYGSDEKLKGVKYKIIAEGYRDIGEE